MRPEEIKPDTKLCTIVGWNAQTGKTRKYFNAILKEKAVNATAIALNLKDDNFDFMMKNLAASPVKQMMLEDDFRFTILNYLDEGSDFEYIDFIEVIDGKIIGYNLENEVDTIAKDVEFMDADMRLAVKTLIIANRWYDTPIDMDLVPQIMKI